MPKNLENSSKYDRKLRDILGTAAQVFMEQGYDRASIRMVAERAKVSVAGLYYYVKSKDELLYLIQFHVFDGLVKRYEEDAASVGDPRDRLALFVRNHLEYFLAHLADLVVCTREIDRLEGEFHEKVDGRRRAYFSQALAVVKELLDGDGGSAPDVSPRAATLALFGTINWVWTWYQPKSGWTAADMSREFVHLYLHGLLGGEEPEAPTP